MSDGLEIFIFLGVLLLMPLIIYLPIRIIAYISDKINGVPVNKKSKATSNMVSNTPKVDRKVMATISQNYRAEQQILSGARWFYWIAGLSVVNLCFQSQGTRFIVGLGSTELINSLRIYISYPVALLLTFIIIAAFVLFGIFASKRYNWAFITGMIVYGADGLLFVWVKDYLSIGFHIFAIIMIFKGFQTNQQLMQMHRQDLENAEVMQQD